MKRTSLFLIVGCWLAGTGCATAVEDALPDPIELLTRFIAVDTVNPPGNEMNAVAFYSELFTALGIEFEVGESAPGRGNIWARLPGGDLPGLMLLQHTDVVPADAEYWDTPPFEGVEKDGFLAGRGAIDMKGTGIAQFLAFAAVARAGQPLVRDVVFLATADEEAGGAYGVAWVIKEHPEVFADIGFLLNEGGSGSLGEAGQVFSIEVTQKVPVWITLAAEGTPGHGSSPRPSSAVTRLLDALQALQGAPFPVRVLPEVARYFRGLADSMPPALQPAFREIGAASADPDLVEALHRDYPRYHRLLRDTCSITMLKGSGKVNVVPPRAEAQIDCRMLPDRTVEAFVSDFRERVAGEGITVTVDMAFTPAISAWETPLVSTIQTVLKARYPDAGFVSSVAGGFTDSHFTRDLGIQSYGFSPMLFKEGEFSGVHGNNEAVHIERYRQSVEDYRAIVQRFVSSAGD